MFKINYSFIIIKITFPIQKKSEKVHKEQMFYCPTYGFIYDDSNNYVYMYLVSYGEVSVRMTATWSNV